MKFTSHFWSKRTTPPNKLINYLIYHSLNNNSLFLLFLKRAINFLCLEKEYKVPLDHHGLEFQMADLISCQDLSI